MEKRSDRYKVSKVKIVIIVLISIIAFIALITLWSRFISTSGLDVKEYKVVNNKLPENFKGLKLVQISDVHYGKTIDKNKLKKVVDKINLINPDIVVFTGDLIDSDTKIDDKLIKDLSDLLRDIKAKLGKYAIRGNHDYTSDSFMQVIESGEFILLDNSYDLIYNDKGETLLISGLSSSLESTIDYNKALDYFNLENSNKDIFSIVLMHEPDDIDELLKYNSISLVLAGHSHGGQIRLPFVGGLMKVDGAKEYSEEYYKVDNTDLYISYGLGTSKYPFRLFNMPSINFYRIYKK